MLNLHASMHVCMHECALTLTFCFVCVTAVKLKDCPSRIKNCNEEAWAQLEKERRRAKAEAEWHRNCRCINDSDDEDEVIDAAKSGNRNTTEDIETNRARNDIETNRTSKEAEN